MAEEKPKVKTRIMYLPRPASKYPGSYPLHFEERIPELIGTDRFIHMFAGASTSGYRVDINPETKPDMVADCQHLDKIADNTFEGGFADPPYTEEFALKLYGTEYPKYNLWSKELVRVVKPGGLVGIMNNYIVPRPDGCSFEEIVVILLRIKQYPKVVTIFRKDK